MDSRFRGNDALLSMPDGTDFGHLAGFNLNPKSQLAQ
jgi:hypothetical protein